MYLFNITVKYAIKSINTHNKVVINFTETGTHFISFLCHSSVPRVLPVSKVKIQVKVVAKVFKIPLGFIVEINCDFDQK